MKLRHLLFAGFTLGLAQTSLADQGFDRDWGRDWDRDSDRYGPRCIKRGNRVVLKYRGAEFRGRHEFQLKRLLRRACGIRASRYELSGVKLKAKSYLGRGRAKLSVDGRTVDRVRVPGRPHRFHSRQDGYYRLGLENYGSSDGRWKLRTKGYIRVQKIVLFLNPCDYDDDRGGRGRGRDRRNARAALRI